MVEEDHQAAAASGVYHSAPSVQHDTGSRRLPRVTSPPTSSMPMSQPPLLPPPQQHHYDGAAHLHIQQEQAQSQYGAPSMQHHAHPPPPPSYQHQTFAFQNGAMQHAPPMPSNMVVTGNGAMRYALPPNMVTPGVNSRNANAKQIKRRTKTGCLTCRKRRIKCDEAHPACRNCQKSKRDCLGYDPIFKQQPGPAPIQPAPSSATTDTKSASPSLPQSHTYSPVQSYTTSASGLFPSPHQGQVESAFVLAPSLDPSLGLREHSFAMSQANGPPLQPARKVSTITMAQLFALNDVEPQWQKREAPPPDFISPEIEPFYRFHYAQGLDKLFETTWYTIHGWAHMQHDTVLLDFVGQCSEQMKSSANDAASVQAIASLEARLVWQLSIMPRSALSANQAYGAISDPLLSDLLPRIDTIENILNGQFLPMVQIPSPPSAEHQNDPRKHNEMQFWHQLGRIASIHDDSPDPAVARDINDALHAMRSVLGLLENRDVLYSLAIARYIGGRLPEYDPLTPLPRTGSPDNEIDKLETARAHIMGENEKGMTQVIQRVCGMAMRSSVLQRQ